MEVLDWTECPVLTQRLADEGALYIMLGDLGSNLLLRFLLAEGADSIYLIENQTPPLSKKDSLAGGGCRIWL